MPSSKKEWVLTQTAFDQLLAHLNSDREQAAERYEDLRQMLITLFEFRGSLDPEEQADETINRVARRISEGQQINASIETYAYAVARNIWREYLSHPHRVDSFDESLSDKRSYQHSRELSLQAEERDELERRLECLENCIKALPSSQRELISKYYQSEREPKIKNRKDLAQGLGIPLNALRIRVSRLRDRIEGCVRNCLDQ
ncbi:MAG: RNA polymerase sigma factor [Pyrinomonadaceae bacterium]